MRRLFIASPLLAIACSPAGTSPVGPGGASSSADGGGLVGLAPALDASSRDAVSGDGAANAEDDAGSASADSGVSGGADGATVADTGAGVDASPPMHPECVTYAAKLHGCYPGSSADFVADCEYDFDVCSGVLPAVVSCRLSTDCAHLDSCLGKSC
jgi:hypothetical protein